MVLQEIAQSEQLTERVGTEALHIKRDYIECINNIADGTYTLVQLNRAKTVDDFYIEANTIDGICLPDVGEYRQSMNLYMYKNKASSGIFLINNMPSKDILAIPDCALANGKGIYWYGIYDLYDERLYVGTRRMRRDAAIFTLSKEEMDSAEKIIRLGRAISILESPYVWNISVGKLIS